MWEAINVKNWEKTPFICGRVATEDDVENGIAVFVVPSGSMPCESNLPICAIHKNSETSQRVPVVVIQAEQIGNNVTLGVRYLDGGNGICTLEEVELLDEPNDEFYK